MKEYIVRVYKDRTEWFNKEGKHHREDGPAIEYNNGYKVWYLNGKHHRENGPAVEYVNGEKFWFLNGKKLSEEEFNNRYNGKIIEVGGKK